MNTAAPIRSIPVTGPSPGLVERLVKKLQDPSTSAGGLFARFARKCTTAAPTASTPAAVPMDEDGLPVGMTEAGKATVLRTREMIKQSAALRASGSTGIDLSSGVEDDPSVTDEGARSYVIQATAPAPVAPAAVRASTPAQPAGTVKYQQIADMGNDILKAQLEAHEPGFNSRLSYEWAQCRTEKERDDLVDNTLARLKATGFDREASAETGVPVFSNGSNGSVTLRRRQFDQLSPHQKSLHFRSGGKLVE